jgi:hypothetical protein
MSFSFFTFAQSAVWVGCGFSGISSTAAKRAGWLVSPHVTWPLTVVFAGGAVWGAACSCAASGKQENASTAVERTKIRRCMTPPQNYVPDGANWRSAQKNATKSRLSLRWEPSYIGQTQKTVTTLLASSRWTSAIRK